jgi:YD repeat-containing protein
MTSDNRYKGRVKRVTIKETFDGHTQLSYRLYDKSGKLCEYIDELGSKNKFEYNSQNQCIRTTCYMGDSVFSVWEYTFNSKGNLIQATHTCDGELSMKKEFEYNRKGEKIKEIIFNFKVQALDENDNWVQGSKEIRNYEYDSHGNEIRQYGTRGEYRTKIRYSDNGLIDWEENFVDGELHSETFYYYDNNGRLTREETTQYQYGGGVFSRDYSYDFEGNCVLEDYTNRDNGGYSVKRIFDFYGNCIGERVYHKGISTYYRETLSQIEYYD